MDSNNYYQITTSRTAGGTVYSTYSFHSERPSPTLLLLAYTDEFTLTTEPYCIVGRLLYERGWNVVSIDIPCHGEDHRVGEPAELDGWAERVSHGEEFTAEFHLRVNDLLDHLINTGITDPERIAAAGTSRGGFMAFHAAVGNPKIKAAVGFSPVTDLAALREFDQLQDSPIVEKLALVNYAKSLSGRSAWICIGNEDKRVSTEKAALFAQALTDAGCKVNFNIADTVGHTILPEWHSDAAFWLQITLQ